MSMNLPYIEGTTQQLWRILAKISQNMINFPHRQQFA